MSRSTFTRVAEWNKRCNKSPAVLGSDQYWTDLENQLKRIQEELDEAFEAVAIKNMPELLDAGCDLDVTVSGLNFLSGFRYDTAIDRVLTNNDEKYTTDADVAMETSEMYSSRGMPCEVQSVVDDGEVYHSVHRIKDNKIMKFRGHPTVELEDLV